MYKTKEEFAVAMSELLFEMRDNDFDGCDHEDINGKPIPEEFYNKILRDPVQQTIIKERIRMSVLEHVTRDPNYFTQPDGGFAYTAPDTYDHSYQMDAHVEQMHEIEFPVLKSVIVCDDCGGIDVQSRAWVRPNKSNEFVDLMSEEIQDNWCEDCDCNVTTSSIQVNIRDPKYIIK